MELYPENLNTMLELMKALPELSAIDGVFEVEVRVRVDDMDIWAVIGWGEAGDPCVLRFEEVPKPVAPVLKISSPYTINDSHNASPWSGSHALVIDHRPSNDRIGG